jgi:outer membrane protein TolC
MEMTNAQRDFRLADIHLLQQKENLWLAEKISNTTMIKYKEGVGSNMEVVNAGLELTRAQTNYMDAIYDFLLHVLNMYITSGKEVEF